MKIGDKVRFLSETGGGRVAGFKGNIVLVEDEDGFQIPTQINNVVCVAESNEYDTQNVVANNLSKNKSKSTPADKVDESMGGTQSVLKTVSTTTYVEERKGGDVLNCYLAFVPRDPKAFTTTTFDVYFVNDSNYFIQYVYMTAEGANWILHTQGEVAPNTKEYIEELRREELNDYDRLCIQMFAYKRRKSFMLMPTVDVQIRLDKVKFYKLHAFRENDFFDEPTLLYSVVENGRIARQLVVDAKELKKEMCSKSSEKTRNADTYARRYEDGKKGNPFIIKKKKEEPVVVDLHASELLETTAGMSPSDILNYQIGKVREVLDSYKNDKGQHIVLVHGKGEGVLRAAILRELQYRYKSYKWQDASFLEYGYGATEIIIR